MLRNGWYLLAGVLLAQVITTIGSARMAAYSAATSVNWASLIGYVFGQLIAQIAFGFVIGGIIYCIGRFIIRRSIHSRP